MLAADGDQQSLETLRALLDRAGYAVCTALSGQAALRQAASNAIDVAVLDLCLPDMSALEVTEQLRQRGCAVPVLILAGALTAEACRARPQPVAYLLKPYRAGTLLSAVSTLRDNSAFRIEKGC